MSVPLALRGRSRTPVVLQTEAAECGLACLAMVAGHYGLDIDLGALRRRASVSLRGTALSRLMEIAGGLGLCARAVRLEPAELGRLRHPAILHWSFDHFVVLERSRARRADILDPGVGRRCIGAGELSACFTGVALELSPGANFRRGRERTRLPLRAFFRDASGLMPALLQILSLTLALQVFALVAPFYGQLVIDEVVISADRALLDLLALAFALLVLLQLTVGAFRSWIVIYIGSQLRYAWSARLFRQLLSLPLGYFEKRHMGDIVSRFGSLRSIESLIAHSAVEAVVDGLMASTTLAVMFVYEPRLAFVAAAATAAYGLTRSGFYIPQRLRSQEALIAGAREQSLFMESVRAIQAIKCFGGERHRESSWLNRLAGAVGADVRVHKLGIGEKLAEDLLFGLENVVVLFLGALAVIDGRLSIGMLVAFLSYKAQFGARAVALIDKAVDFRLAAVHLERLADIVHAEPERTSSVPRGEFPVPRGRIEVRRLSFRYAEAEPFVLSRLDLDVAPGECLAIAAPSGHGKTTLLKLMLGLLEPSEGAILVDGRDLRLADLHAYRQQVAAVMQHDHLLSGSLAENIAFFAARPDEQRIVACARLACVDEDILRMPMGYQSLVGDMGAALSGGQKQRLLLARALYREPRILFLDEATSHLDAPTEARILAMLAGLGITRVLIAHRRQTLAHADRIFELDSAGPAGHNGGGR
ncbi:MAG TPA: peptidase domain-containing ABC transporter [Gammaproteobacteria bacterium]|nr:peptidase domain-containing ABC transporter [Gammaproteobacteria bacterium]